MILSTEAKYECNEGFSWITLWHPLCKAGAQKLIASYT